VELPLRNQDSGVSRCSFRGSDLDLLGVRVGPTGAQVNAFTLEIGLMVNKPRLSL
jgi:hypothetical protein